MIVNDIPASMAGQADLIDFDIIESHKENIQSLPSGRSARALVNILSPLPSGNSKSPCDNETKTLNDAIRQEYENELQSIDESDDPLDVFDRYVKWTLNAYPTAQATPQSQLLPLLEKATKTFLPSAHYKNDPRYLKLWLHYIRLFSDSPRETFAFLARHKIGEGLALFYEEFAAWLEGAGRWNQAEEVYKLGIEREARPTERLMRKFAQFQQRYEQRPENSNEPSSPALPTVRPALAARIDPFASSASRPNDPQAPRPNSGVGGGASRTGKPKMAIFSDAEGAPAEQPMGAQTKGWESIGSLKDRKKENTVEAKPWAGETMKGGKRNGHVQKMEIFKDQRLQETAANQQKQNPKESPPVFHDASEVDSLAQDLQNKASLDENTTESHDSIDAKQTRAEKPPRTKKLKVREVSQETQTIKTKLGSPAGPKIRRKATAEPTMTFHSRAATDEIYSIFNQPLKCETEAEDTVSVAGDSDDDYEDDDYTSAGESTCTGRISGNTSEFGDETGNSAKLSTVNVEEDNENITLAESLGEGGASEWTEFTVPKLERGQEDLTTDNEATESRIQETGTTNEGMDDKQESKELITPVSPETQEVSHPPRYIPVPPEDQLPPKNPYRNPYQTAQNRLPFMTPIVEKTESSLAPSTIATLQEKDYFTSKTPSRSKNIPPQTPEVQEDINDSILSSPFRDVVTSEKKNKLRSEHRDDETSPAKKPKLVIARSPQAKASKGPIIHDLQVNPVDDAVRATITKSLYPPLSSYSGFHDHSNGLSNRGQEIRKYVKTQTERKSKGNSERTQTSVMPPMLCLEGSNKVYAVKRELGKGAFAPVYLLESVPSDENDIAGGTELFALKMEDPPTSWEFVVLRTLRSRLGQASRTVQSLINAQEFHLYRDECFLILDYSEQGTLLDLVNLFRADNARNGKSSDSGLDEVLAMFFAVELFRIMEDSHRCGIIHGDLKADNCLVRLEDSQLSGSYNPAGHDGWSAKGLTLIDFGRGIDVRKFRPEAQFIADWETGPQDCPEMRELRPWTWQVDYFGMAGVIHSLLFGKYIDSVVDKSAAIPSVSSSTGLSGGPVGGGVGLSAKKVWKLKEGFKRYWQGDIWSEVFSLLLNPTIVPDGDGFEKMPLQRSMKKTRERMEEWLISEGERKGLRTLVGRAERMVKERAGKGRK
ncbi:putative checkpoint serine threonine-protein kinase bub1 [Phaeomoniella chlamydospora]|uniref:Putative checkpoint serine threonine-protein kinase bub1 n=1 Tax=Phaeomoniella chlamydospora TaxID=158046 RepID=A0A0G2ESV3_PHACM|nr:putative checkpoint serine threonine-protein kinase bub1 [Phaeomoniella chlamydospora]